MLLAVVAGQGYQPVDVTPEIDPVYTESDPDTLLVCPDGTTPRMTEDELRRQLEAWLGDLVDQDVSGATEVTLLERPAELRYPRRPLAGYKAGHVVVMMLIENDGTVPGVLVNCSSDPLYEASAVEFVSGYRFSPATLHGKPIRSNGRQPIDFGLPSR
ncbi:energy transducer TonB [Luteimonas deserti]|uniref:energy transducer TonB n=1 Tax=Luteimonas deserti TaxID=2752306 RepID=UPI002E2D08EB|nr:energy transducer TonB [Luteimonas deserti]